MRLTQHHLIVGIDEFLVRNDQPATERLVVSGFSINLDARFNAFLVQALGGGRQGLLQCLEDDFFRDALFACQRICKNEDFAIHSFLQLVLRHNASTRDVFVRNSVSDAIHGDNDMIMFETTEHTREFSKPVIGWCDSELYGFSGKSLKMPGASQCAINTWRRNLEMLVGHIGGHERILHQIRNRRAILDCNSIQAPATVWSINKDAIEFTRSNILHLDEFVPIGRE